MPKRSSKKPDTNQLAKSIVEKATHGEKKKPQQKNAAAVELGRLGGIKGGPARKAALSPERRREIAKQAAERRWAAQAPAD
jgi:hypothetical protein